MAGQSASDSPEDADAVGPSPAVARQTTRTIINRFISNPPEKTAYNPLPSCSARLVTPPKCYVRFQTMASLIERWIAAIPGRRFRVGRQSGWIMNNPSPENNYVLRDIKRSSDSPRSRRCRSRSPACIEVPRATGSANSIASPESGARGTETMTSKPRPMSGSLVQADSIYVAPDSIWLSRGISRGIQKWIRLSQPSQIASSENSIRPIRDQLGSSNNLTRIS